VKMDLFFKPTSMTGDQVDVRIDVFKCVVCGYHKPGTRMGHMIRYPLAKPPRQEITCKDCAYKQKLALPS
jgi:hypothetical protein